ncbi:MAG: Nif3-like dinuclear metal center hexameric protein [Ruminococcaceae bacterium]|nr:Nif3-like dinuclear metal center hexameric protein [Oscillospiraceae bacterium]
MKIAELYAFLEEKYPRELSCSWDNDGMMLCPDPEAETGRILICLDATEYTLNYAVAKGYKTVVTHHPMLFRGPKSITPGNAGGRRILKSLSAGITVLSYHTRLDAAEGGVNDTLCRRLGYTASASFGDAEAPTLGRIFELPFAIPASMMASQICEKLGCPSVRLNGDGGKMVQRIAVCGGDGKDFIFPATAAGADLFLTGDAGYNMALDAAEEGLVTVEAGHYHTEAPVCHELAEVIRSFTGERCAVLEYEPYTSVIG